MKRDEALIMLIAARIMAEYRKHKELDWAKIAAIKIVHMLDERLPSAEGAEKSCKNCRWFGTGIYHDMMWCRDCQQLNHYEQKEPTAEGMEEILTKYLPEFEGWIKNKEEYWAKRQIKCAMHEFAALNAGKMAEEKLREELIKYNTYLYEHSYTDTDIWAEEPNPADEYLKSRDSHE